MMSDRFRVADRLRVSDLALLSMESATAPMQVATLDIFATPPEGFEFDRLLAVINDRIAFVPRFRQRVQFVPGGLTNPLWIDDSDFDLEYHVRRSALPRPGSMSQLRELTARIMSRRLDRTRPLWETYLVEGLHGGQFAILSKSHHVLVDGATVDLGQLILGDAPDAIETPEVQWAPARQRSGVELVGEALVQSARSPAIAADNLRGRLLGARKVVHRASALVSGLLVVPGSSSGPLDAQLSEQRRFATVETRLASYRKVRRAHGGSVNDAVLAVISGALRSWLLTRAESVAGATRIRALVPMSVVDDEFAEPTSLGTQLTPHLLDLPVGESNPVMRLHQVSYAFKAHKETGRAVSAQRLTEITGFAPATFHALGSRIAAVHSGRSYQLVITNVPGPQFPLYAAGARMTASYPVLPLLPGHPLAIGATSYNGKVCYGLDADRDAVPDVEVLAQCIGEALDELVDASSAARTRAPRGRIAKRSGP